MLVWNTRRIIIVFCVLIFSFSMFGCSGTKPVDEANNAKKSVAEIKPVYDGRAGLALKQYLFRKYGGNGNDGFRTSWYDSVVDIRVLVGETEDVTITTKLNNDNDGKQAAEDIANAILRNGLIDMASVSILDGSEKLIIKKNAVR